MPPSNYSKKTKTKSKKPVKYKIKDTCRDTSCAGKQPAYPSTRTIKVEETLKKNKEVKEKDVFEMPSNKAK